MMRLLPERAGARLRRVAKAAVATALCRARTAVHMRSRFTSVLPIVLGYHRVVDRYDDARQHTMAGMLVSRAMLERHLDALARRCRLVGLDELGHLLEEGRPLKQPVAAVTFDDGYRDVYENAVPLLLRKGIPAAVFVVSDLVGTDRFQVHDRLYMLLSGAKAHSAAVAAFLARWLTISSVPAAARVNVARASGDPALLTLALMLCLSQQSMARLLDDLEACFGMDTPRDGEGLKPMTWEMLATMQRNGITIGSHSCTHARLANEPPAVVARETTASRQRLEQRLGVAITHFAYPNGSFNSDAVRAVADSGYRFAYTACFHQDRRRPLLTIPRVLLWEHSSVDASDQFVPEILDCQTRGLMNGPRACQRRSHL